MKNSKTPELKEIGATVDRNQNKKLEMIGSDGRWYRYQYHKGVVLENIKSGDLVRIWYLEPQHNDIEVTAVEGLVSESAPPKTSEDPED